MIQPCEGRGALVKEVELRQRNCMRCNVPKSYFLTVRKQITRTADRSLGKLANNAGSNCLGFLSSLLPVKHIALLRMNLYLCSNEQNGNVRLKVSSVSKMERSPFASFAVLCTLSLSLFLLSLQLEAEQAHGEKENVLRVCHGGEAVRLAP